MRRRGGACVRACVRVRTIWSVAGLKEMVHLQAVADRGACAKNLSKEKETRGKGEEGKRKDRIVTEEKAAKYGEHFAVDMITDHCPSVAE